MDAAPLKAFEFAADLVKHLITLSTGMIGLTVTFSKEIAKHVPDGAEGALVVSWFFNCVSVVFGIWTLMALTGSLAAAGTSSPSIQSTNVSAPAAVQVLTFVFAIIATSVYGYLALKRRKTDGAAEQK